MEVTGNLYLCCEHNTMGWSQDRQRSQAGLHNPLPAWPWALEEVRAASGTTVLHHWGQALPCHDTAPMQTVPNSSAVLHLFPLRCCHWFPTLPVALKQMLGAKKYRDPSGSVLLFVPNTNCNFFYSVICRKRNFGWHLISSLRFFFHGLVHPNCKVHPAERDQKISKHVKHFSRWWFFLLKILPRGFSSFLPCLTCTPLAADPQL